MDKMDLIAGTPLQLGNKVYVCPALNLKGMRAFKDELTLLEKGVPVEQQGDRDVFHDFLTKLAAVACAALQRNYPSLTLDEVEEGIDFNNVRSVVKSVMGASGYTTNSEEVAKSKLFGEQGTTPMGESTGTA